MKDLTQQQKQSLTKQFFIEGINVNNLSDEEYKFYYKELTIAKQNIKHQAFLYFDVTGYSYIKGYSFKTYNSVNQLIENVLKISVFEDYVIGDNIGQTLINQLPENKTIHTNLPLGNHLSEFIRSFKIELIPLVTKLNYDILMQIFIDFTGKLEEQNNRITSPDLRAKYSLLNMKSLVKFREQAQLISHTDKTFPKSILALLYWYYTIN